MEQKLFFLSKARNIGLVIRQGKESPKYSTKDTYAIKCKGDVDLHYVVKWKCYTSLKDASQAIKELKAMNYSE